LGAGIYFTVAANKHDSDAERVANVLAGNGTCSDVRFSDAPGCAVLRDARQDGIDDQERALVGFIGFGVASAVTLGYALWLALDGTDRESAAATQGIEPSLAITPGSASFTLQGQF
jgi:hypothetical protein